jgi:hypothetical protein
MQPRSVRAVLTVAYLAIACSSTDTVGTSNLLAGTYVASVFVVTPTGQSAVDVLAAGGSLSITIKTSGTTSGSLNIPSSVTGGAPLTASMAGTAIITSLTVEFDQTADTFVRDLIWSRAGTLLTVVDQPAGGASYSITLLRQ